MESRIRHAVPADRHAVEQIVHEAYSHYVTSLETVPGPLLDDYGVLIDECRVHVLEHNGEICGIVVLIPQQDAMLLDNVAVSPRAQGIGFGRRLLEFAEGAAIAAGYAKIRLYTQEAMTTNVALYHRIGYRDTHKAEEKGLRRVYMMKDLAPVAL
jgi:GNAT superfamily N-acetyltransferase